MSNEPAPPTYSLGDLADRTGIPERTIRSYIGRGLLPPPDGRGRAASYGPAHLESLQFLKRVRAAVPYELPLAVLERLLRELPPEQIARVARGEEGVMAVPVMQDLDPTFMRRKRSDSESATQRYADSLQSVREDTVAYLKRSEPDDSPAVRAMRRQADFTEEEPELRGQPLAGAPAAKGWQSPGVRRRPHTTPSSPSPERAREAAPELPETWTTLQVTPNLRLSMRGQAPAIAKRLTVLAEQLRHWLSKEDSE